MGVRRKGIGGWCGGGLVEVWRPGEDGGVLHPMLALQWPISLTPATPAPPRSPPPPQTGTLQTHSPMFL